MEEAGWLKRALTDEVFTLRGASAADPTRQFALLDVKLPRTVAQTVDSPFDVAFE